MFEINLNQLEHLLTSIALFFGGLFFLWKLLTGWLVANLDVIIELERQKKDNQKDWLKVSIFLKKGSTDSIWLKEIAFKVCYLKIEDKSAPEDVVYLDDFRRRKKHPEGQERVVRGVNKKEIKVDKIIDWDKVEFEKPSEFSKESEFSISPGETFQYGKIIEVEKNQPLIIEVCVFGSRLFWHGGAQWRSTAASLPLANDGKE